jgi:hypothetical protein
MQLSNAQPTPLTALLQLNFCYPLQTALVPPDAHLSSYSSVATIFYPTLVFAFNVGIFLNCIDIAQELHCYALYMT